jgi:hypothetical protein
MARTRGTGLLMAWTDIGPEHEAAFNAWYDREHINHLLKVPGFLSAGRYRALRGGPKYLAMYELEEPEVLNTADFLDNVRYKPSPDRARNSPSRHGRNFLLNGYRQIFPARINPADDTHPMAAFLQMGRMDIPAHMEEEFNDWYNTAYIPGYLTVPGVLRVRRFVCTRGMGPKYLTVYEFANPNVPESAEWKAARESNPWSNRVRPHMRLDAGSPAVFERIFPK